MRNLAHEAGYAALDEIELARQVLILFPLGWGAVAFDMGRPPEGVYIRFASSEPGLKSLAIATLITVDDHVGEFSPEALLLAKERLRGTMKPKWIRIRRGEETETFNGSAIWN